MQKYHYVILAGHLREVIFASQDDYRTCLKILESALHGTGAKLFHYCLMPNRIHLLLDAGPDDLNHLVRSIFSEYAQHFKKAAGRKGRIFDRKPVIRGVSDEEIPVYAEDIEKLPVRARLARTRAHYPYSSYAHHAKKRVDPLIDLK